MGEKLQSRGEQLPENVKIIDLPEARYRLIYERHDLTHSPEEVGKPDAYASELILSQDYSNPQYAQKAIDDRWRLWDARRMTKRYADPYDNVPAFFKEHLEKNSIPIYLIDLVDNKKVINSLFFSAAVIKALEMMGGAVAGAYLGTKIVQGTAMSRRQFLKSAGAAVLVAKGALLATDVAGLLGMPDDRHAQRSDFMKNAAEVGETINPETEAVIVTFRNAVWAHKFSELAKEWQARTGGKPEIAVQLATGHSGVETMLRMDPRKRLDYIQNVVRVISPIIAIGENGLQLSPVGKFEYSREKKQWLPTMLRKDPELQKIEQGVHRG